MKRLITLILIECFLVNALHADLAWAGGRLSSAVGRPVSSRPAPSLLRPKAFGGTAKDGGDNLKEFQRVLGEAAKDGDTRTLKKSPFYANSYAYLGRGLLTDIEGEEIEILEGELTVNPEGYLVSHQYVRNPYSVFARRMNRKKEPYGRIRRVFAGVARHYNFRFANGMKTLIRREKDNVILLHAGLAKPKYMPPEEIFWEFWVTLLRSSAVRHDAALVGSQEIGFTAHLFGLLGEVGRLVLMNKEKREKLKDYLLFLSRTPDFSFIDGDFVDHYMEAVDEVEERLQGGFVDLSRGTRRIYTDYALSLPLPPLLHLLNPKGWSDEAFLEFVPPRDFRIHLSTELKRLRRTEEFQRVVRTIDGEGDARIPETAIWGDIKMSPQILGRMMRRSLAREVDKIIVMGDLWGPSHGRSLRAASPLTVYDMFRKFEAEFPGRGVYLFGPDELNFLFVMMGYPGIEEAWYEKHGGKELLAQRNREIEAHNARRIQEKGDHAKLLERIDLNNFRDDPRLKRMARWMKNRFYIYHLDEFGILYVNGALPGVLKGRERVSFAEWDRLEELIRASTTFKEPVFQKILDVLTSPVMAGEWKEKSQKLDLAALLPTIRVDGEGGHEVIAIMTGAPHFNQENMSFGNDFDDIEAEGGPAVALRFIGRNGIVLDRLEDGVWVSHEEESPESFLSRVRENALERIQIVARAHQDQNRHILSLLRKPEISEESEALRFVRQAQQDIAKGAKLARETKARLIKIAERVLYGEEETPDRDLLFQTLGIEPFHGNILYNDETREGILLVGLQGIGRGHVSLLLSSSLKGDTAEQLYPGWRWIAQRPLRVFAAGETIFGGTTPMSRLDKRFKTLYYRDRSGEIVPTDILPQEEIVEISRIVILTRDPIAISGRKKLRGWINEMRDPTHQDRVNEIINIQGSYFQTPSSALISALHRTHIEKFHVGVEPMIRDERLRRIAYTIDADVGRRWWGPRWAGWFQVHFPPANAFFQALKELRRSRRDFPAVETRAPEQIEEITQVEPEVIPPKPVPQIERIEGGVRKVVTVVNPKGLHLRPIAAIVEAAKQFPDTEIRMRNMTKHLPSEDAPGIEIKDSLGIMMLAAGRGDELEVSATGKDMEEALEAVEAAILRIPAEDARDGGRRGDPSEILRLRSGQVLRRAQDGGQGRTTAPVLEGLQYAPLVGQSI